MAFYVKLGPRGILFRAGTIVIGVMGSWVYWRATRRRGKLALRKRTPQLLGAGASGSQTRPS